MSRILVLMLSMSTFALASDVITDGSTDIVERTLNFILFAGLIWYLVAEPAKSFFQARTQSIADELKKVQDRLNESIALKKEAEAKIADAEKYAEELVVSSKKENKLINEKMIEQSEFELETLTKQHDSAKEFEQRKMVNNVVEEILNDVLNESSASFDKKAMASIILKKVA
ncbi:MAG: F0F1 ATP synthase subunit B [Campylobacterota bacterium]|nr:F0F1 ATP synthase subunit B [Campylobacterota bacterium]